MKFTKEMPKKSGRYILLGNNNVAYNAQYSEAYNTLFFAIPKDVDIIGYCSFEELEDIYNMNPEDIKIGEVYNMNDEWIHCKGKQDCGKTFKIIYGNSIFDTIYLQKQKK